MHLSDDNFAVIDCPVSSQAEGCRITRPLTALPPQLTLQDEIDGRPSWSSELRDYVADLPPAYTEHVVTQRAATVKPIPLALYFDGVQFATRNSILGLGESCVAAPSSCGLSQKGLALPLWLPRLVLALGDMELNLFIVVCQCSITRPPSCSPM